MYQTSSEFAEMLSGNSRTFKAVLINGDNTINCIKKVTLNGSSNGDTDFSIGATVSQYLQIVLSGNVPVVEGVEYLLKIGMNVGGADEWVPMGYFTCERPNATEYETEVTAYDRMAKLECEFTSSLADITTTIAVINRISVITGVVITTTGLTSISMAKPSGKTCREVLTYIAQLYGGFAVCDRTGKIVIKTYTSSGYELGANRYFDAFKHNNTPYTLEKITCNTGVDEDGNTVSISVGSGTRGITFSNPYMTQAILNSIWTSLEDFSYMPCSTLRFLGDPRLDVWDLITIKDRNNTSYTVPLMTLNFIYDGGLTCELSAVGQSEIQSEKNFVGPSTKAMERYDIEVALIKTAMVGKLDADVAEITYATIDYLNANFMQANVIRSNYADIHLANIATADVGTLLADIGLISSATIVEGHVTGYLSSVKINADVIDAGTLSVDRLLVTGADSIVYQINVNSSGLSLEELSDDKYKQYLNGTDIVANSVTTVQLAAHCVTTEILASGSVTTSTLAAGAVTAEKVDASITTTAVFNAALSNLDIQINDVVYDMEEIPTLTNYPAFNWYEPIYYDQTEYDENGEIPYNYTDAEYQKHVGTYVNVSNTRVYRFKNVDNEFQWVDVTDTPEGYVIRGYNHNTAELSLKVDTDRLCSVLSASADEINITGNRIAINSSNFDLDYDGNVVCNNLVATGANISGQINATSGSFTGSVYATSGTFNNILLHSDISIDRTLTFKNYYSDIVWEDLGVQKGGLVWVSSNWLGSNPHPDLFLGTNENDLTVGHVTIGEYIPNSDGTGIKNTVNYADFTRDYIKLWKTTDVQSLSMRNGNKIYWQWSGSQLDFWVDDTYIGHI